nr:MAG TPA: MAEBL protein [Caudoviricetes sp.]
MAKKKSKKINWGGGAGFYDPSTKTKINSSVKNEQYKKSLEKKSKKNNNKSSESPKNTPTAKSGGGSSSNYAKGNTSTVKAASNYSNNPTKQEDLSQYVTKPKKSDWKIGGSSANIQTKVKTGIESTNQKMLERSAKIAQNHQNLQQGKTYNSGNASIDKSIQASADQNAMRNGNKTSDADKKAQLQNEVYKQRRAKTEDSVNKAKETVSKAVKKQAQTVKENFTDSELRQRRLNENSQANIDLADTQTALSRNGQVENPTWKNKKPNKINLNDATQVSKLNKKATESSETIQKNLDRNALLGVIADTNASYVKGVENAVSSGLQSPANALATVGRVVGNKTLQDKAGGFAQDMYNATAAADKAMQDNNSVYSNAIGQTFSSVGNMLPQTLLGLIGVGKVGTLGLMASNVYGSEMSNAMNNYMAQNNAEKYSDVSNDLFARANLYALASAGKEVGTEMMDKVIPGYQKLNVNDILEEGLEEVAGGVLEPYINQILTANSVGEGLKQGTKELGKSITSGGLAKQGIMGSASALLANAPYSIADTVSKAKARSENNKFIKEHGTETEKNFGRVVSDYNLAKENYGITKNETSKSIIDKTQYNINHDNGVVSDYMVNNSNETFRKYARDIQAEAIRNAIGSERTNQQTNAFIKSVNDNNLAVEFADNVNVNGEKVFAKRNGDNGITFDNSILKDKSINLDETLRQTLEKGYALKSDNAYEAESVKPSNFMVTGDTTQDTSGLTNEQKNAILNERKAKTENAYVADVAKPSSFMVTGDTTQDTNALTNEQKAQMLKDRREHPEYAYQTGEVTRSRKKVKADTDTIDLGTDPNGMTNEQKNQVLADRKAMYEQGMNAFKLRSPQERTDFETDRQSAQELNERAKKASETGNKAELGNVLRESSDASEETKQAVKETVREDNKKAAKELTGKDIDDKLADAVTDVAEDVITKAYKGVRDAAQGKHGENAEQRANAREASENSEFRYETTKDADTLKSAQERIDAFKKDGKLDANSSNEILKDIQKSQDKLLKSTRKDGYLSNEHQYEQSYVVEATNQLADIEASYRAQLEKQGFDVTRNFDDNGVSYVVKDAEGNEINNELTKYLQDSAHNASEARKVVMEQASVSASMMRNIQKMWSAMPKEEKIYDLQKLVKDTQAMIDKNGLNKNGEHILTLDAELMKQFDSAENNSAKQGELFDEIVKDLARQTPRKLSDKINAYRNISMLLSTPTNLRNVVGNLTSEYLSKFSNIGSSTISLALDKAGYFQKAELDLTDAKNKYYYDFSNKVVSNAVKEIMNKNSNVKADGILAKDIKKWKGGADNVDAFLNRNADFKNRLQHNVGTKLVELAKQEGALTKNGHFTAKFLKDNADSIQKMVVESYNQSAKAKALMSESSFLREDGTLAKATKANKAVAKQFLEEIGGEEGATGDFNGRFASGDALGDTGNNVDAKSKFKDAFREETFVGRESKLLKKYLGQETGNMTHDALAKAAKAVFGDDFNVGVMHNAEKLTNWLLNNGAFGDSAFFRSTYASEWARYIDSKGYTASFEKGENGTVYKFTDKNGKVLDDVKANALMDEANKFSVIEAQEAVFHQASEVADKFNAFKKSHPLVGLMTNAVMPFTKTPINIAKNSVTYSPIGLLKGVYEMTKGVQSGRCTADEGIRHLGKGMTGSMLVTLGAYLFAKGILNGTTGDDDKDSFEESRGKQSYSLNLPNGTYSLSWLSVANVPLFTGVNAMQIMTEKGFSNTDALEAVASIADPLVNASFMSGLVSTLKQLGGSTNYDDKDAESVRKLLTNVFKTYITQFFPSAGKHINTVLNQYKKSTYDDNTIGQILNSAQTAIPFMAANLQNQVDVYGNDVENVGGDNPIMRALYTYLSIGTYKPYDKTYGKEGDSYTNKLEKIAEKSGDSNVLPYVSSSIQGTKMNAEERHDLNQYMLKNYNNQVHSLFESGILDGYNLNNKEDATQVAELLGKIKSHYFYEAKARLYKRTNPKEASSVLTNSTKATQKLAENGIPVFLTKYLQSQPTETDSKGAPISISKPLRNRRLLETLGLYDNVMDLYKERKITDLYNVGLSSTVAKMSQQEYEYKLDDLDNGLIEGSNTTSDLKRRKDTFDELGENQKFSDALTAHDIDYGTFANYKTIKAEKKDGKTVYNSRAEKIIAQMEEDGVLEGFKEGIRDGSFNYDNITQFGLTSKQVEKLLGLEVQKTSEDDDDSSSGSSSNRRSYSGRSRRSSRRSSGSRRSSSSSSSSATAEETPTFDISGALKAINKGASKTSSGLTQSQLQSLYNSTVSSHNTRISQLQTLVNKGKK